VFACPQRLVVTPCPNVVSFVNLCGYQLSEVSLANATGKFRCVPKNGLTARVVRPSRPSAQKKFSIARLKGKIDFGIISIRDDEYLAVLDRFRADGFADGRRQYEVGTVNSLNKTRYRFAAVRLLDQGQGSAHDVIRIVITPRARR
jgi:hypothetical protein